MNDTAYMISRIFKDRISLPLDVSNEVIPSNAKHGIDMGWYTTETWKVRGGGIITKLIPTPSHPAKNAIGMMFLAIPYPVIEWCHILDLTPVD